MDGEVIMLRKKFKKILTELSSELVKNSFVAVGDKAINDRDQNGISNVDSIILFYLDLEEVEEEKHYFFDFEYGINIWFLKSGMVRVFLQSVGRVIPSDFYTTEPFDILRKDKNLNDVDLSSWKEGEIFVDKLVKWSVEKRLKAI